MIKKLCLILLVFIILICSATHGDLVLVEDGQPKATIVIGSDPSAMAREAAAELQYFVELITGAQLTIVENPSALQGVQILVGQAAANRQAEQLGLKIPSGLTYLFNEEGYIVAACTS